jgi:hypothetical protein
MLLVCYIPGMILLALDEGGDAAPRFWLIGFLDVALLGMLLVILPLARQYYFNDWYDSMVQLGFVRDILSTGAFVPPGYGGENSYPANSLLAVTVSLVTSVAANNVGLMFPALFFAVYLVSLYTLLVTVGATRKQTLFAVLLGSMPAYSWQAAFFLPRNAAFSLFPLALALWGRSWSDHSSRATLLAPIMIGALTLFHPLNGIPFLMLVSGTMVLLAWRGRSGRRQSLSTRHGIPAFRLLVVAAAIWGAWFVDSLIFNRIVVTSQEAINGRQVSQAVLLAKWAARAGLPVVDALRLLLRTYAAQLIYVLPALSIGVLEIIRSLRTGWRGGAIQVYSVLVLLVGTLALVGTFSPFGLEFVRLVPVMMLVSVTLLGFVFGQPTGRAATRRSVASICFLALSSLALGCFTTHPSPWILNANQQVTRASISGMAWFLEVQDARTRIDGPGFAPYPYAVALKGNLKLPSNIVWSYESQTPDHFAYDVSSSYGAMTSGERYILIPEAARAWYLITLPSLPFRVRPRYVAQDFQKLLTDPSVLRTYDSKGFEVYRVTASKQEIGSR